MERPYKIIDLQQNTPEWIAWRQDGIGASDAPTIMRENPYKRVDDLLARKTGLSADNDQNAFMQRGIELEPAARSKYCAKFGKDFLPACMQSIEYNWLRASVDGITNDGSAVVEIKCGVSTLKKTALARQVPAYYYGQLQHILMVTGLHTIDFWCYLSDSMNFLLPVNRNEDYIKRLLEAEKKFWEQVLASKTSPV